MVSRTGAAKVILLQCTPAPGEVSAIFEHTARTTERVLDTNTGNITLRITFDVPKMASAVQYLLELCFSDEMTLGMSGSREIIVGYYSIELDYSKLIHLSTPPSVLDEHTLLFKVDIEDDVRGGVFEHLFDAIATSNTVAEVTLTLTEV